MSDHRFALGCLVAALALVPACGRQPASPTSPSASEVVAAEAAADGSTLKADAPLLVSPVNDQQAKDSPTLVARPVTLSFDGYSAGLLYRFEVFNEAGAKLLDSGLLAEPAYLIAAPLSYRTRHTWRVRAEYQGRVGPWSKTASFISFEGGYIRGDEVYDPLYDGFTVGERIGQTSFVGDRGIRLDSNASYVRYVIPTTITRGEFSMEVMGLRADAPGDKSKVFGMSTNSDDFITDPYRFDVQYRGLTGSPPNAITFRALYGSAEDTGLRYEPDTNTRFNSIYLLDPNTVYFWKATWGSEVRVSVREGGINGRVIYDVAVSSLRGSYSPMPHYAYLGVPSGRSGVESASIAGTIFRNVWIGARPRPTS